MSWLKRVLDWIKPDTEDSAPFCRQFAAGHALADKGEFVGALDSFRDVPRSAREWKAARFNQAVLLARLGYLTDAITIYRELSDQGIVTDEEITACSCAMDCGPGNAACQSVSLKLREDALAAYEVMAQKEAAEARTASAEFSAEQDRRRMAAQRHQQPPKRRQVGLPSEGNAAASGRQTFRGAGKCDMCDSRVSVGSGQLFSTQEVITTEIFWTTILQRHKKQLYEPAPKGEMLLGLLDRHVADRTDWCLCTRCASQVDLHRAQGRHWAESLPLHSNAAFAAAYAWLTVFNHWPDAIAFRETPAPPDGTVCSQCGRRAYPDEQLSLITDRDLFNQLKAASALRIRFASGTGQMSSLSVFCQHCMKRALRIAGAE